MNARMTCLFGGALMSAGLTPNADAQTFTFQDDSPAYVSSAYVAVEIGDDSRDALVAAPMDLNLSRTALNGDGAVTARTLVSPTGLSTDIVWNGLGDSAPTAASVLFQNFTVDVDAHLLVVWDFGAIQSPGTDPSPDFFELIDVDNGETVVFDIRDTEDPLTGFTLVPVSAGVQYLAYLDIGGLVRNTDPQGIAIALVPAPGAVGVLGVAGVAAARRRR